MDRVVGAREEAMRLPIRVDSEDSAKWWAESIGEEKKAGIEFFGERVDF